MENNLVGKYLEISGEIAGRIEQENEKAPLDGNPIEALAKNNYFNYITQ